MSPKYTGASTACSKQELLWEDSAPGFLRVLWGRPRLPAFPPFSPANCFASPIYFTFEEIQLCSTLAISVVTVQVSDSLSWAVIGVSHREGPFCRGTAGVRFLQQTLCVSPLKSSPRLPGLSWVTLHSPGVLRPPQWGPPCPFMLRVLSSAAADGSYSMLLEAPGRVRFSHSPAFAYAVSLP